MYFYNLINITSIQLLWKWACWLIKITCFSNFAKQGFKSLHAKRYIYIFYADSNAVISDVLLLSALKRNFSDLKVLHVQSNTNHPDIIQTFVFVGYTIKSQRYRDKPKVNLEALCSENSPIPKHFGFIQRRLRIEIKIYFKVNNILKDV